MEKVLTCTVVIGIEQGEQGANGKDVGVLVENHFGRRYTGID